MQYNIEEIATCAEMLSAGKLILYPTDTVWGIGCDATNQEAIDKVFSLKQREDSKTMIILISAQIDITRYVTAPDPEILQYLSKTTRPTTAIYKHGKNVAPGLVSSDGTIAIRIIKDEFCVALINKLKRPLVSTSANISGNIAPANFSDIDVKIKNGVDYLVQHRRSDFSAAKPSAIIKLNEERKIVVIRS